MHNIGGIKMKDIKQNNGYETMDACIHNQKAERLQRFSNSLIYSLDNLCEGTPENHFDAWCRKRLYPVLAVWKVMPFGVDKEMYERRLAELCEGEPEDEFDKWLRDRFYPIVAVFKSASMMR